MTAIEHYILKKSYAFGALMDREKNPLTSRIYALAIPVICLVSEVAKIVVDGERLITRAVSTCLTGRLNNGNVQSGVMHLSEHTRNIAGVVSGVFFGMFSPKVARSTFLMVRAKDLKHQLTTAEARTLYELGGKLHTFFLSRNIDYRICSGTMLGAVRHGGIIPWDDDIDLMLHPDSIETFRELVNSGVFEKETGLGITWQPFTGGWQCFDPNSRKGTKQLKNTGLPFVDIFCTKKDGDKIVYQKEEQRQLSTGDYYTDQEWRDVKDYTFGPITMRGVNRAYPYVARCYGRDAIDFAYQTMHHDAMTRIIAHPFQVQQNLKIIWDYGLPRRALIVDKSPINIGESHG